MDCSPSDSSVHGIFQARIVEWVAISFFWTQESNPCLLHGRQILYGLSYERGKEVEASIFEHIRRSQSVSQQRAPLVCQNLLSALRTQVNRGATLHIWAEMLFEMFGNRTCTDIKPLVAW